MLNAPEPQGDSTALGDSSFEVEFVTGSGERRQMRWQSFPPVAGEIAGPVRSFSSYRGQKNFPGWYWSATLGRRVGFESWVERDHLVALDFDPAVSDVVSQPFTLLWDAGSGRSRRHTPDFLVRLDSGRTLVLDSRPLERIKDRDRDAFAATARACGDVGWEYAVWDRLDPVPTANHRWLGGYQHPRCFDERVARDLLRVFARPQQLLDGAEAAGDTVALAFLLAAEDFELVGAAAAPKVEPINLLESLPEKVLETARDWERHVIEVETGLLPDAPQGSEPRLGYDPAVFSVRSREKAKAEELSASSLSARPNGARLFLRG
ncbi:TnsA-like heteromeric transposase endonuclease subunit [Nocardia sp. NBC_01327]|uniref:TnsA-like heteromeric transposase endonuclease subunit n=1 Tax=Nocardia sp. NBC_01327 TaxID=2903593 RepID=UPI002E11B201|nr:TnsA-like heteromeric transposase endonuclease subunit [Nocardia sp. NBC_01327]